MESNLFTFGVELELVLVPDFAKLGEVLGDDKTLDDIQKKSSAFFDEALDKKNPSQQVKEESNIRKLWAKFIAKLLSVVTKKKELMKWADDPELESQKEDGTYYNWWTVIDDDAIRLEKREEWTVEIVSRVTSLTEDWTEEFKSVWSIINEYFTIQKGERGSTHVHVKHSTGTGLSYGKAVAKFVTYWDPCLYLLAPSWRQKRLFCMNNIRHSPLAEELKKFRAEKYENVFKIIDKKEDMEKLYELMNEGRLNAWNFENLYSNKKSNMKATGTIEYRRCPMSESLADICAHVAVSVGFVHAAVTTGHDSELYKYMANDFIIFPDIIKGSEEYRQEDVRLPAEIVDFGKKNFDHFLQFMLVSTQAIRLEAYMPKEQSKK